jgi:ABC-type sugar transport system ATPase subunit
LVKEPKLLLFDEPLSNLDARLRLSMRGEIKRLQIELGVTSIYVTHDQVEAMTMADRVAVMRGGKLQAYDPPDELYDRPRTLFVGGFVGNPPMNFIEVEVVQENGDYYARSEGFEVTVPAERGAKAAGRGTVTLGIRPEDISILTGLSTGNGAGISSEAYLVEPLGRDHLVEVMIGDAHLYILADPKLGVRIGDTVNMRLDTEKVQFFDPETEKSLLWD